MCIIFDLKTKKVGIVNYLDKDFTMYHRYDDEFESNDKIIVFDNTILSEASRVIKSKKILSKKFEIVKKKKM